MVDKERCIYIIYIRNDNERVPESMTNCAVIIPALNPDRTLVNYINRLKEAGLDKIIVVNDGSGPESAPVFETVKETPGCFLLEHEVNKGKGQALRTAFEFFLAEPEFEGFTGVVTADADGQHLPRDTLKVAMELEKHPDCLILGCRDFDSENVPFKSKKGNKITSAVMKILFSRDVSDTQTGLRGLGRRFCRRCLDIKGDRFEFEMNMLIEAVLEHSVVQVPIQTVYFHQNRATSFKAVKDSAKIYSVIFAQFFKFCFASISSSVLDIALFSVISERLSAGLPQAKAIFWAGIGARLISAVYNYLINRKIVFRSGRNVTYSIAKYAALAACIMFVSAFSVRWLYTVLGIHETVIKICVDVILFIFSFKIQQLCVFEK